MIDAEKFGEYTRKPDSAWSLVEKRVFEYAFGRYFKDRFNWLNNDENRSIPAITTKFGRLTPDDFRVLDLGTGTGHIPESLIDFGVKPQNIVGLDNNSRMLENIDYPLGVHKLCADVRKFSPTLKKELSGFGNFDLVTANMVFHLLTFGDYVKTLKQIRNVVTERAELYIMLPHPLRDEMNSIPGYHQRGVVAEIAPWGEEVAYGIKTISDYCRGLKQTGFHCWIIRTTGVGLRLEDNLLLSDEAIWSQVQSRKKGTYIGTLPHYFRLWLMAFPE